MSFPDIPVRVPKECKFDERTFAGRLGPDAVVRYVQVPPVGGTNSFSMSAIATPYVIDSGMAVISTTPNTFQFNLPCGQGMMNNVLECNWTNLSGVLSITVTTAGVINTNVYTEFRLISSIASIIGSSQLTLNNVLIESINYYGLLQDLLICLYIPWSQRSGNYSESWLCDDLGLSNTSNSNTAINIGGTSGIQIPLNGTGTFNYSFSLPLLSFVGMLNGYQYIPVERFNGVLSWYFTSCSTLPFASYSKATGITTQPVATVAVSSLALNCKYVNLGVEAGAMLRQSIGPRYIAKYDGWQVQQATIAASSVGGTNVNNSLPFQSIRSIFHTFGLATVSGAAPNQLYDKFNPGSMTALQWNVNGVNYPQIPLNPAQQSALTFQYLLDAVGRAGGDDRAHLGLIMRYTYNNTCSTASTSSADDNLIFPASGLRNLPDGTVQVCSKFPSQAIYGINLETTTSPSFYAGVNCIGATPITTNMNFSVSVGASNITMTTFCLYDRMVMIDEMGQVSTKY